MADLIVKRDVLSRLVQEEANLPQAPANIRDIAKNANLSIAAAIDEVNTIAGTADEPTRNRIKSMFDKSLAQSMGILRAQLVSSPAYATQLVKLTNESLLAQFKNDPGAILIEQLDKLKKDRHDFIDSKTGVTPEAKEAEKKTVNDTIKAITDNVQATIVKTGIAAPAVKTAHAELMRGQLAMVFGARIDRTQNIATILTEVQKADPLLFPPAPEPTRSFGQNFDRMIEPWASPQMRGTIGYAGAATGTAMSNVWEGTKSTVSKAFNWVADTSVGPKAGGPNFVRQLIVGLCCGSAAYVLGSNTVGQIPLIGPVLTLGLVAASVMFGVFAMSHVQGQGGFVSNRARSNIPGVPVQPGSTLDNGTQIATTARQSHDGKNVEVETIDPKTGIVAQEAYDGEVELTQGRRSHLPAELMTANVKRSMLGHDEMEATTVGKFKPFMAAPATGLEYTLNG